MLSTEKLTGFADEASRDTDKQISATTALGWSAVSTRMIGNSNIHDMPVGEFEAVADNLDDAGITVVDGFQKAVGEVGADRIWSGGVPVRLQPPARRSWL